MSEIPSGASRLVRFGVFELDVRSGDLRKAGTRLNLAEQPLQILIALLERPGDLVTRDDLRQRLWPGDVFVDFEHGLNAAVKRLREVLGDSADTPRFVETVPRRGYRFVAAVEGREPQGASGPLKTSQPSAYRESPSLDSQVSSLHQRLLASDGRDLTRLFYETRLLLSRNPDSPDVLVLLDQVRSAMDPSAFAASMGAAATAAILNKTLSPDLAYAYARSAARAAAEALPDAQLDGPAARCWLWSEMGRFPLREGDNVLGRGEDARVVLESSMVSRHHARVTVRGDVALIEDLGSKNGTYVGDERVSTPRQLQEGDQIRVGAFVLAFHRPDPSSSTSSQTGR
jgi:DNA-binding winged helix-turn-helix (wHTH) protein